MTGPPVVDVAHATVQWSASMRGITVAVARAEAAVTRFSLAVLRRRLRDALLQRMAQL